MFEVMNKDGYVKIRSDEIIFRKNDMSKRAKVCDLFFSNPILFFNLKERVMIIFALSDKDQDMGDSDNLNLKVLQDLICSSCMECDDDRKVDVVYTASKEDITNIFVLYSKDILSIMEKENLFL